jgi:chromosome segregation ATPase
MITLEQIRRLEQRVQAAVARIATLKNENALLREKLESYEGRVLELENSIAAFKRDQSEIEQGIVSALNQLDQLEDEVLESSQPPSSPDEMAGEAVTEDETSHEADTEATAEPAPAESAPAEEAPAEDAPAEDTEDQSEERRREPGELDIF